MSRTINSLWFLIRVQTHEFMQKTKSRSEFQRQTGVSQLQTRTSRSWFLSITELLKKLLRLMKLARCHQEGIFIFMICFQIEPGNNWGRCNVCERERESRVKISISIKLFYWGLFTQFRSIWVGELSFVTWARTHTLINR